MNNKDYITLYSTFAQERLRGIPYGYVEPAASLSA